MKQSVGLLFLTRWKGEVVAVLRARGYYNFEKMEAESWPGLCQVTCHGRLEEIDKGSLPEAVIREAEEELGEEMALLVRAHIDELRMVGHKKDEKEEVTTFALFIEDPAFLKFKGLASDSGAIRFAYPGDNRLCTNKGFTRDEGVPSANILALFPDELEAVRNALALHATDA